MTQTARFDVQFANSEGGWVGLGVGKQMNGTVAFIGRSSFRLNESAVQLSTNGPVGFAPTACVSGIVTYWASDAKWSTLTLNRSLAAPAGCPAAKSITQVPVTPASTSSKLPIIFAGGHASFGIHTAKSLAEIDVLAGPPSFPTPTPTVAPHAGPSPQCLCCSGSFCSVQVPVPADSAEHLASPHAAGALQLSLSWTLDASRRHITLVATAPIWSWISIGVSKSGQMNGAVVVAGSVEQSKGATVQTVTLSSSGPQGAASGFNFSAPQYVQQSFGGDASSGALERMSTLAFSRPLVSSTDTVTLPMTTFIVAVGPSLASFSQKHAFRGAFEINLTAGTATSVNTPVLNAKLVTLHAVMLVVAWALLAPLGALLAAYRDRIGAHWFKLHRALQVVAVGATAVGFVAIVLATKHARLSHWRDDHGKLGLAVAIMAALLPIMAMLRPSPVPPKSGPRICWEFSHRGLGYAALILGFVNVLLGTREDVMDSAHAGLKRVIKATIYVCVAVLGMALFGMQCARARDASAARCRANMEPFGDVEYSGMVEPLAADDGDPSTQRNDD